MFTLVIPYIITAAGYSVITYLLGVGDRHLDNLLLSESGHLIHVDFGYILGRDPKVFPPPMKLNKEMVEGMGGTSSVEYQRFREHCYNAFLALRRYYETENLGELCGDNTDMQVHGFIWELSFGRGGERGTLFIMRPQRVGGGGPSKAHLQTRIFTIYTPNEIVDIWEQLRATSVYNFLINTFFSN